MTRLKAVIGDIHGCIEELMDLHALLLREGVEEFYHLGDLVDRGPDSAAVVRYCRNQGFRGVMGNHESSLLAMIDRSRSPAFDPGELTAERRSKWDLAQALSRDDILYIRSLPKLHVLEEENFVLVHGGLWPGRAIWEQDRSVLYLQVIHPDKPGLVRWTERPGEYTLAESRAEGFAPWQEIYDGDAKVVYGHTVVEQPHIHGLTIGIDTGCVYGGNLSALVLPTETLHSVAARRAYAVRSKASS